MTDRSDEMHINLGVRLGFLRGLVPVLIGSHPRPSELQRVLKAIVQKFEAAIRSDDATAEEKAHARECLAEVRLLASRLQHQRTGAQRRRSDPTRQMTPSPGRSGPEQERG